MLIVVDVEERHPRALRDLAGQVGDEVVTVQVDLVGHVSDLVALQQLVFYLRIAGHGHKSRQPVEVSDDLVGHAARLDMARPADHRRHSVGAFPVRVLLAAERRHRCIRPRVHVRAVVGAVHDEGVVRDAQVIQRLEDRADILVVVDHGVVVRALPAACLADALRFGVGAEVHVREVHPDKGWLAGLVLPLNEVHRTGSDVVIDRLHPLLGQRAGVLAHLLADLAEARIHRRIVHSRGLAIQHAARAELRAERRVFRVVGQFRLFFGVQVVQIAVELVEAVYGGQVFVAVAQMVLAELAGRIASRLSATRRSSDLPFATLAWRPANRPWSSRCASPIGR